MNFNSKEEKRNVELEQEKIDKTMRTIEFFNEIYQHSGKALNNRFLITFIEEDLMTKYRFLDEHGRDVVDYIINAEYERCMQKFATRHGTVLKPIYYFEWNDKKGMYISDDYSADQDEVPLTYKDIDFILVIDGHYMEPTYKNWSKLMIKLQEVQIGEIGIFMVDGKTYIRKLGNNKLISLNDEPDIELEDEMNVNCFGKVIGML